MSEFTDHMAEWDRKERDEARARKASRLQNLAKAKAERETAARMAGISVEKLTASRRAEYERKRWDGYNERIRGEIEEINHGPATSPLFAAKLEENDK